MIQLSGWTLGYVITNQLALAFILWLTPDTSSALTQYQSAFIFFQLPHGLIAVSIMTAIAPEFAAAANAGDFDALRRHFRTGLQWLLLTVTPAAAGYVALARPIVADTVGHGRFSTASAIAGMANALTGFSLGLVAFSVYLYTLRAFYARGDTKTPFFVNAFENGVNIAAAAVFFPLWGVGGLAGAYSLAYVLAVFVALAMLRRAIGPVVDRAVAATFARALLASVVAALGAWGVVHVWSTRLIPLVVAAVVGVGLYGLMIVGLHEPAAADAVATVRRRMARRV
jgi:putative peptidoglycan lipid II flippase